MLKVRMDSRSAEGALATVRRQLPFAASVAINECLKKAQIAQRAHQRSAFHARNTRFMDAAVKIKPFAKKTSLFGVIQIDPPGGAARADILTKFEEGGTKRPRDGRSIAVPGRQVRRTSKGVTSSVRPRAILGSGKAFIGRTRAGKRAIFQRLGSGRGTRIRYLYSLVPRAKIKPLLRFKTTVWGSLNKSWRLEIGRALKNALATARR
jgi:hypothetical protein